MEEPIYLITEDQLEELAEINPEWPEECERRDELVAIIRSQRQVLLD